MPLKLDPPRSQSALLALLALLLAACGQPDPIALKRLACDQVGSNLDIQSLAQLDALRKALGLAPNVDPIGYCRSIGARLEPVKPAPGEASEPAEHEQ